MIADLTNDKKKEKVKSENIEWFLDFESGIIQSNNNILIILGTGGTGSFAIPNIMRFLAPENRDRIKVKFNQIYLIDGDKVESKNVGKQNFIKSDIGKYKAEVLAKRYGISYGIDIKYINEYFEDIKDFEKFYRDINAVKESHMFLIDCVDNIATRKIIYDMWSITYNKNYEWFALFVWIHSGNHYDAGQIIISYNNPRSIINNQEDNDNILECITGTPCLFDIYPNLYDEKDELPTETEERIGCAERMDTGEQSFNVNSFGASLLSNVMYNIIFEGKLNYYHIYYNLDFTIKKHKISDIIVPLDVEVDEDIHGMIVGIKSFDSFAKKKIKDQEK